MNKADFLAAKEGIMRRKKSSKGRKGDDVRALNRTGLKQEGRNWPQSESILGLEANRSSGRCISPGSPAFGGNDNDLPCHEEGGKAYARSEGEHSIQSVRLDSGHNIFILKSWLALGTEMVCRA